MIYFWLKLASDVNRNKLAVKLYNFVKYLHDNNLIKMKWFDFIKNILDQCGLSCFWNDINGVNTKWLVETVKMILKDQFKQTWLRDLNTNSKCINYRIFRPKFGFEDYLLKLDCRIRILLCKLRLGNSKLSIERGRYNNVQRKQRYCELCNHNIIGDEFHFILECTVLNELRLKFLPKIYQKYLNAIKLSNLFNSKSIIILKKLCKYVEERLKLF